MRKLSNFSPGWRFLLLGLVLTVLATECDKGIKEEKTVHDKGETDLHRFMVLDPGHFHAALAFKRSGYDGVSPFVFIYAPVGEDVVDHMERVVTYNTRKDRPSKWRYEMYLAPDFLEAMLREKYGDIVLISGANNEKIDRILASVNAGINVLADKPWLIEHEKFPLLESALTRADENRIVAYDNMTERYEITAILQQVIVGQESIFGNLTTGSPDEPAVVKSSVHHLYKLVSGRPNKRPWWFFDTSIQGNGMVDVTTHLVDLMFWILYPEEAIDYKEDVEMVSAKHWPTILSNEQFTAITQKPEFPSHFTLDENGNLPYYCNGQINFRLNNVNVRVQVEWNYQAPEGTGDTHYSVIKGTRAHVLVLQGAEQNNRPTLYIEPAPGKDMAELGDALTTFIAELAGREYPGLSVHEEKNRWRIDIPQKYRVGHEAHFGQVIDRFLAYVDGEPMPSWERANMLAKYYITTKALELCRSEQ